MNTMETAADRLSEIIRTYGIEEARPGGKPSLQEGVEKTLQVDTIIVNGTGCEPLVATDRYLLRTEKRSIVRGIEFLMESLGAENAIIALNEKYRTIYEDFSQSFQNRDDVKTIPVGDFYPSGDEPVLVYEVTGRVIPRGGSALDARCVVVNVDTVFDVHNALSGEKPVTKVFLSCAGEVRNPSIVQAHTGVSIGEIVSLCGGPTAEDCVAVVGGPIRGHVETDFDTPVRKDTKSVIVLPREHEVVQRLTMPLEVMLRRSKAHSYLWTFCTDFCPLQMLGYGVDPTKLMQQIAYNLHDTPVSVLDTVFLCSSCGVCDLQTGALHFSPSAISSMVRSRLHEEGYQPAFTKRSSQVHEMREARKVPRTKVLERLHLGGYDCINSLRCLETDPSRVEIMLDQGSGVRSKPVVAAGEEVAEGCLIAESPSRGSGAHIHASIDGRVIYMDEERMIIEK